MADIWGGEVKLQPQTVSQRQKRKRGELSAPKPARGKTL